MTESLATLTDLERRLDWALDDDEERLAGTYTSGALLTAGPAATSGCCWERRP
jgi:hypothetical protein